MSAGVFSENIKIERSQSKANEKSFNSVPVEGVKLPRDKIPLGTNFLTQFSSTYSCIQNKSSVIQYTLSEKSAILHQAVAAVLFLFYCRPFLYLCCHPEVL